MADYFKSYYSKTKITSKIEMPDLPTSSDVIIVGGGLAGLTTALELAKTGQSVTLLETHHIGWGASGRNGGFVAPGFAAGMDEVEKRVGLEGAKKLYALSKEGAHYVGKMISDHDMQGVNPVYGKLSVIRTPNTDEFEQSIQARNEKFDEKIDYIPRHDLQEILKTNRYFAAGFNPDAFHIHPLNYALELARIATDHGVTIIENCPVTDLVSQTNSWIATTPQGTIAAPNVVIAGSAYLTKIAPSIRRAILPVSTYVVVSDPMGEALDHAITKPYAISDSRRAGDYYRRLQDGRLLWGGRITTRTSVPPHLKTLMRNDIISIYPQLSDIKIEHAWTGWMGYAIHKMPIIGEVKPGLWSATGFGGHGLNTTAMAGLVVSRAITGIQDDTGLFKKFPAYWGGGIFGRAATQLAYWGMQAKDRWDERQTSS